MWREEDESHPIPLPHSVHVVENRLVEPHSCGAAYSRELHLRDGAEASVGDGTSRLVFRVHDVLRHRGWTPDECIYFKEVCLNSPDDRYEVLVIGLPMNLGVTVDVRLMDPF